MIITQTPLRISLSGGGTDLKDYYKHKVGMVVSTAIDKYIYVIVKERFDDLIYINYSKKEIVSSVADIQHELIREAMIITGIEKGVEITMLADIPSEGSGLGSSSSMVVGLLNALYMYQGIQVTAEQLAAEACEIEIIRCNNPIGKQDQYIAAYGGISVITFHHDEHVEVERLQFRDVDRMILGSNLLLFYTGVTRKSSEILNEQKQNTNAKLLELEQIRSLAEKAWNSIIEKRFDDLGPLLHRNWELKKTLSSKITYDGIDEMYAKALEAGALGGKIAGAGGGGFLLLYCPREKQNNVRKVLIGFREMPFLLEKDGSKVIFNYRRYGWK